MKLNRFFPYEHFTLVTKLTIPDVRTRIEDNTRQKKAFNVFSRKAGTKPYEGKIEGFTFSINRVINYRNPSLPVIKGYISSYTTETQIEIKMRQTIFSITFMSFWLGIVGLVCLSIIVIALLNIKNITIHGNLPSAVILIPFVMFAFGWALMLLPFRYESKKSKEFLQQLLEATEMDK